MKPQLATLIEWIREVIGPDRRVLIPVSGGSDSAFCFWLCAQALPGRANAAHIGGSLRNREWFEAIGPVCFLPEIVAPGDRETLRWAATISHASTLRARLIGSRNRTEDVLGTYSLPSRVASYMPLAGIWKSDVMPLCEAVGVPREVLASSLKADPACGRPIEMAEIPFAKLDCFLQVQLGERPKADLKELSEAQVTYLDGIYRRNQYKTKLPMKGPQC